MRLSSNNFSGYAVELNDQTHAMIIRNEEDEIVLTIPVDDILERFLDRKFEQYGNRKGPRVNASLQLKYTDQDGKEYEGMTGTIGSGGLFLESQSLYSIGSSLTFEIKLPHQPLRPIRASGDVVWTRPRMERVVQFPGMGIQFKKISSEDQQRLLEFVEMITRDKGSHEPK